MLRLPLASDQISESAPADAAADAGVVSYEQAGTTMSPVSVAENKTPSGNRRNSLLSEGVFLSRMFPLLKKTTMEAENTPA